MSRRRGRAIKLVAAVSLVLACVYGRLAHQVRVDDYLPGSLSHAVRFHLIHTGAVEKPVLFSARDSSDDFMGYVTVSEGSGYGGPMLVVIGWSQDGKIQSIRIPRHSEDAPWFRLLENRKYMEQYVGRRDTDPLGAGSGPDSVTGATRSCNGVAEAVLEARELIARQFGHSVPPKPVTPIQFIPLEALLLLGLGMVALFRTSRLFGRIRWRRGITLGFGFLILGFWLQQPLSLSDFAVWMAGYSPQWRSHIFLYGFFLLVFALVLILGRNLYCFWLCPFCAVQEGAHLLTGSRVRPGRTCDAALGNTRYVLLWVALFLALLWRNPSVAIYEPWATLFTLKGAGEQWILVVLAVGAAMLIHNFWCRYLCPVGAILELVRQAHHGILSLVKRTKC